MNMNLTQIKRDLEQLKAQLTPLSLDRCACRFVMTDSSVEPQPMAQAIIEANKRCQERSDVQHVGFSYVEIVPVIAFDDCDSLTN